MEHLKSYYTIEKHLEESSKVNSQFETLDAIWKLNKRNLAIALSNVSQYFPHYSLHEKSHSKTIISNIELFLGEDRIKKLSPTNAWLILMSAFTHDLGMVVFQDLIHKEWLSDGFQEFLKEICESEDAELKEDALLLIKVQQLSSSNAAPDFSSFEAFTPIKVKNAVVTIVAEYIRRIHHQRSSDIIKGADKQFFEIANSFYSDQIPRRLLNVLGEVAYLHGVEFYEIFKRLEFESNGISTDRINPRLIACLLRLGDLLDVDDSRFNLFTERVFKYPNSSQLHKQKHSSIKHILITPEAIEITSDCPNEEVYRLARSWFDWLEKEVEKQSKEWSNIAPSDLGGSSPTIPKGKIKVYYNSKEVDDQLLNLRFEVSTRKIFEILEGASIYEKAELTFIRELVQNALDASKIQLWREIEKGTFDFAFRNYFREENLNHIEIIQKIKFPTDIPDFLYDSFEVKLTIDWKDNDKEILMIKVNDQGTGISNQDLLRMTTRVGESRKKDKEYQKLLERIPFWLRPTGAFGIGLQSVFIITDTFRVETKSEGEMSKEIIFRSAKKGKYSSLGNKIFEMPRGTSVIVEIPKGRFPEIFGTTFSWDIVMNYDYFTDKHNSMYIPKIRLYIDEILPKIKSLKVDFFNESLYIKKSLDQLYKTFDSIRSDDDSIYCKMLVRDNELYFNFFENIIGSEFLIQFFTNFSYDLEDNWTREKTEYFVRDIPVKDSTIQFYKLSFSKLYWNFMSPDSDKILSLTREKFISRKKYELQDIFLAKIIPKAIELAERVFLKNIEEVKKIFKSNEQALSYGYFKLLLTKRINQVEGSGINRAILGDIPLHNELVERLGGKKVKMNEFFSFDKIIVPVYHQNDILQLSSVRERKKTIVNRTFKKYESENVLVIWNNNFFKQYISQNFNIQEVYFYNDGYILYLRKSPESITIKTGNKIYLERLLKTPGLMKRGWYYSNVKYEKELSIENRYATGFEYFPYLSNRSIISPFKDEKEYQNLKKKAGRQDLSSFLTEDLLRKYISKSLLDWIKEYTPPEYALRNDVMILNAYKNLIIEMIKNEV